MTTQVHLAAFAFDAYELSAANRIVVPHWTFVEGLSRTDPSGFAASVYSGPDDQIVIAFRGTDNEPPLNIDWATGNTAALGIHSEQVRQAIETLADVMHEYPAATIRLTGHSLGGGLASLLAVYFNLPATVFAAAPFEASAQGGVLQQYFDEYVTYQFAHGRGVAINQAFQSYAENASGLFAQRYSVGPATTPTSSRRTISSSSTASARRSSIQGCEPRHSRQRFRAFESDDRSGSVVHRSLIGTTTEERQISIHSALNGAVQRSWAANRPRISAVARAAHSG